MPDTIQTSDISRIEDAIARQLSLLSNPAFGLQIVRFSDNADELGKPFVKGRIIVAFKRETFSPPRAKLNPSAPIVQERQIEFELLLQVKNLRTHGEVYPLLQAIREQLCGFLPFEGEPRCLYEQSCEFSDLKQGIWTYTQTWAIDKPYYQRRK